VSTLRAIRDRLTGPAALVILAGVMLYGPALVP
jgi:hypothetical protein